MNNIDKIISESIEKYLLDEIWYKPSTWFKKTPQFQEPSPEEIARRQEAFRLMDIRRAQTDEYYKKLQTIIQDISKGKETRLLDVGDNQGNQAYSLFESFVLGLMNITDNYINYGNIGSNYTYWKDKINIIENMLNFIHGNKRLSELANKIDNDIRWCVMYFNNMGKILNNA